MWWGCNTLSHSSTTFQKRHMFILWRLKNIFVINSKDIRCWWITKWPWRSTSCDPRMEESLSPKTLMPSWLNVKSNNKLMLHIYLPQQNGGAERARMIIVECAKSMILVKTLNLEFWAKVVNMIIYIKKSMPNQKALDSKTLQNACNRKSNVFHLRVLWLQSPCSKWKWKQIRIQIVCF